MPASPPSSHTSCRAVLVATALAAVGLFIVPSAHALKGDANGDGAVNVQDSRLVADYLVGNVLSIPRPEDADVSGDGQITTADALLILQFAKGLRTTFDFQSPLVLTVLPAAGSTNVLLTANIAAFFSEPISMTSLSGALTLKDVATGIEVPSRIERSQEGVIATVFPDQPLSPLTTYRIDVTTAVTDNEDNPLQQPFFATFQTQALGTGVLVSTNNLSAPINELAPQSVIFKALNSSGSPVRQVPVTFTARMGSGVFEPSKKRQITVLTDDVGIAQASFRLGGEAVLHTVAIAAVGFSTVPKFTALALPLPAVNLRLYSGNSQSGFPGSNAPFPLIVQATDAGGNLVADVPVTFTIIQGQGNFTGQPTAAVLTDSSGTSRTSFTFGASSGTISIQAGFPGMVGQAPTFSLLNLLPQPSSPTVIVGRVVDAGTLRPIHHIYVYLVDTPTNWDWTDENGAFRLTVAPGSHVVSVNGFESGPISGKQYPVIAIPVNAVEGQVNDLGMPALLPELDPLSYLDVSDTQGGTLTLRSNPLWKMYVAPGQTRFANGTRTGRLYVASVQPDRIPMPVAGGKTSRFFDTVQPLNVSFDPPAQVSFPNMDNLPAGTVTDIFTLSYTSGTFVRTGRGQVSEEGSVVNSLPGEGITQGGWHDAPKPNPDATTCIDISLDLDPERDAQFPTLTAHGLSAKGVRVSESRWSFTLCNVPANSGPFDGMVTWGGPPGAGPPLSGPPYNGPPNNGPPDDPPPDKPDRPTITGITITADRDEARPGDVIELTATVTLDDPEASKEGIVVAFAEEPTGIVTFSGTQDPLIADSWTPTNSEGVAKMHAFVVNPVTIGIALPLLGRLIARIGPAANPRFLLSAAATLLAVREIEYKPRQFEMDTSALQRALEADSNSPLAYKGEGLEPAPGLAILSFIRARRNRVFYSAKVWQEFIETHEDQSRRAEAERFLVDNEIAPTGILRQPVFEEALVSAKRAPSLGNADAIIVATAVANSRRLIAVGDTNMLDHAGRQYAKVSDPTAVFHILFYADLQNQVNKEFKPFQMPGE